MYPRRRPYATPLHLTITTFRLLHQHHVARQRRTPRDVVRLGPGGLHNTSLFNMPPFQPRAVFPTLDSLPRSYYLGHHAAGLAKMRTMLSQIDLVIECRDYRIPLTSRNPMFEESLAGRARVVVYTKMDLGSGGRRDEEEVGYPDA